MKKGLILILTLLGFALMAGCGSETTETVVNPADLKPPLGLVAYAGDQAVTLEFVSSNSEGEKEEFWGFAAHIAEGDFSAGKVPGSYYDDPDVENFDTYGDGTVCGGDSCDGEANGLQPAAYVEGGLEVVASELGVSIPGTITWLLQDGDDVPLIGDVDEEAADDDDDDAVADDDDDDAALVYPSATSGDDDDDDDAPTVTGGGTLSLDNGQIYTVFVVTRANDGDDVSWTSNYTTFIPRPESAEVVLTPGADWDSDTSTTDGLDIGNGGVETFEVIDFTDDSATGLYVGADDAEASIDLMIEASGPGDNQYGLIGEYPYFSAANGSLVQDLGYYSDWALAMSAPVEEASYVTPGMSVLVVEGHVYAIRTGDGYFAKVWVSSIDTTDNSVTLVAAYQTLMGEPSLKK